MTKTSEKIRTKMEKARAQSLREARRVQALASQLSKAVRAEDTHRKILEGVVAMYGCDHSEEYRQMHEQFRARALYLPKDRAVFGLPLLDEKEVERRAGRVGRAQQKKNVAAAATAPLADSSAEAPRPHELEDETEAA